MDAQKFKTLDNVNVEKLSFLKNIMDHLLIVVVIGAYSIPIAKEFENQNTYAFDASQKLFITSNKI